MMTGTAKKDISPISPKDTVVGIIGVGDMGFGIATSIVRTFPMVVYDVRPEPVEKLVSMGARRAASLEQLADECDVAVIVVANDEQVTDVVGKLQGHPGKLHTVIVGSTILPSTMTDLESEARKAGIDLIDAPVTGGTEKAERGVLTLLIGGEKEAIQRCRPLLEVYGKTLLHMGPLGAGSAGKLVNNLLSVAGYALALEGMQLADAYGISEDMMTEVAAVGSSDSRVLRHWGRLDRNRRNHPQTGTPTHYEHFTKDVKIAALAGAQRGVTLPIAASIGAMMAEKLKARDKLLDTRGKADPIPLCNVCGGDLAFPFRKIGVHPECA
jgi:3-hydroxyisobutyrate dehydrogenase-like beta-hydroxyacid dehydrogenase